MENLGDIGEVDLFGLDEFGEPAGRDAMWGVAVGGLATGAAIAIRALAPAPVEGKMNWRKWSDGLGFLAAGVVSGAMIAMPATRYAGWIGLGSAFLSSGLRQLEQMLLPTTAPSLAGYGEVPQLMAPVVEMGAPVVEMGAPIVETAGYLMGDAPPVNLVGIEGLGAGAEQVQIQGGPEISGLGAHFGATLFG